MNEEKVREERIKQKDVKTFASSKNFVDGRNKRPHALIF